MAKKEAVEEVDYTVYADKAATDLQERFGDWLVEQVGLSFSTKKEEVAFKEGVRLATALRMPFQRSPENQEILEDRRGAAKPVKAVAKKTAKRAPVVEEEEDDEEEAKPVKAARKPAKRVVAPVETEEAEPRTRRPARRRSVAATAEAPF